MLYPEEETKNSDICKEKIGEVYLHACRLKDQAIKFQEIEYYIKASEKFQEAIKLIDKAKEDKILSDQLKRELTINQLYYNFEKENCLTVVFYEKRDIDKAEKHYKQGIIFLKKSINLAQESLDIFDEERKTSIEENITFNKFLLNNSEGFKWALKARKYWDKKNYVIALDYYRKSADQYYKVIGFLKEKNYDPKFERIVKGNFVGMMANASSAFTGIILGKVDENYKNIPFHLLAKLFYYGLEAYKQSDVAFQVNPESNQYMVGAQKSLQNIKRTLKELPLNTWRNLYFEFYENEDFLKVMKMADIEKFKSIEEEYKNIYNSNSIIIVNLLLWLTLISFPFLSFKFLNFVWWEIFTFTVLFFIVLIVINVVILRSWNKLSEDNFIELIKITLKYTFKILEFATKKFRK